MINISVACPVLLNHCLVSGCSGIYLWQLKSLMEWYYETAMYIIEDESYVQEFYDW